MPRWTGAAWPDAAWCGCVPILMLVAGLAACSPSAPQDPDPVLAFALSFEPSSTEGIPVPRLPDPDPKVTAALEHRPLSSDTRLGVALIGTRLYRYHLESFGQSYELRQSEPNPILQAFAALSGRDTEDVEFLPSGEIHKWVLLQPDLATNPLIQSETNRIEAARKRDRWSPSGE